MTKSCRYCSEPDSHGIYAVVFTADGDECEINFAYCPVCGNKMECGT